MHQAESPLSSMAVGQGLVYKGQVLSGLFSVAISSIGSRTCSVGRQVWVAFQTPGSQETYTFHGCQGHQLPHAPPKTGAMTTV